LSTTVLGARTWLGDRNCVKLARSPVTGFVKVVASVLFLTPHTVSAFNRLSKSIVASRFRLFGNLINLPTLKSILVRVPIRLFPNGSSLMIWLLPNPTARLICRVTGGPCCDEKLPLRITSCHGRIYIADSLNWFGRSAFDAPHPLQRLDPVTTASDVMLP